MRVFNLAEELEKERKKNKELQDRIDKAIKYIDKKEDYFNDYPLINRQDLLDILKGDNK